MHAITKEVLERLSAIAQRDDDLSSTDMRFRYDDNLVFFVKEEIKPGSDWLEITVTANSIWSTSCLRERSIKFFVDEYNDETMNAEITEEIIAFIAAQVAT